MVLKTFIDTIISAVSGGVQSDDRQINPKFVYHTLLPIRSRLISQKINKKQKISDWTYQTIPCIKLIPVDAVMCPCVPPDGCKVMRSEKKIPKPLTGLTFMAIEGLYIPDMSERIIYTTKIGMERSKGGKYTSGNKNRKFMIVDEYIYVYGEHIPDHVVLRGILYDPLKALDFKGDCEESGLGPNTECLSPIDLDFPIDADLEEPLMDLTLDKIREKYEEKNLDVITNNSLTDIG